MMKNHNLVNGLMKLRRKWKDLLQTQKNVLLTKEMNEKLSNESIDVSLPGMNFKTGSLHPLTIVTMEGRLLYWQGLIRLQKVLN